MMDPWILLGWLCVGIVVCGVAAISYCAIRRDIRYAQRHREFEADRERIRQAIRSAREKMTK